ncbi:hypothetical protein OGH69_15650 [Flavobacterium sp. MFBS3-15]|uniref:hypothetical protein n=1 Tax=Flavobacterium sp. MFBS3-15 TaxID=2989816 RepID=UPI00223682E8|nr:hypothetical protein [Flavobacterium sp. MFBS3-15]MCW4470408.1 hypothetical protein [Flavobacterium sp. MFBS3-15]
MNLKPIIVSLSSLLIFSCVNKNDNATEAAPDRVVFKPLDTLVSDEVVNEFYDGLKLDKKTLSSYSSRFTTQKNRHNENITDTIYRFYKQQDTITMFSNATNRFPLEARLANPGSHVVRSIKIGSTKEELLELLNRKEISPEFYITDTERGSIITMVIEDGELVSVRYEAMYVD